MLGPPGLLVASFPLCGTVAHAAGHAAPGLTQCSGHCALRVTSTVLLYDFTWKLNWPVSLDFLSKAVSFPQFPRESSHCLSMFPPLPSPWTFQLNPCFFQSTYPSVHRSIYPSIHLLTQHVFIKYLVRQRVLGADNTTVIEVDWFLPSQLMLVRQKGQQACIIWYGMS